MRILIADNSIANSKALRPLFKQATGRRSLAKKSALRGAPAAGQLIVSCAPAKGSRRKSGGDECACNALDLGDQPEHTATILDAMGIALLNRGCLEEGAALIELARKIRLKFFGPNHPATAASQNSFARVLRERGSYSAAEAAARDALRINRAVFGAGLPVAVSLNELGAIQLNQGRFAAAQASAVEGLDILATLGLQATDPNTTRLLDVRGRAESGLGNRLQARDTYKQLLQLDLRQLGTKNHPKYATHLANFAAVREASKDFRGAEKDYRKAIDFYRNGLNRPCHPNLIDMYANLGSLLRAHGKSPNANEEARTLFENALRLDLQLRGDSHVLVANDHANLGRAHYDAGTPLAALKSFAMAVRVYERNVKEKKLPAEHYYLAEARTWQGRTLVESGKAPAAKTAERILRDAVAAWPVQLGPDTAGEGIAKGCLGRSLFLQDKERDAALKLLAESVAIVRKEIPPSNPVVKQIERWFREAGGSTATAAC